MKIGGEDVGVGRAGVLSLSLSADELLVPEANGAGGVGKRAGDGGEGAGDRPGGGQGEGGAIRGAFLCCKEAGRLRTLMGAKVAEGKRRLGP